MSCAIRAALPCWPFELSPLNVLYRGTLMGSITLKYPLRYVDDIWHTCISGQDCVSHARTVGPLCCPFELSPFNDFKGECLCAL